MCFLQCTVEQDDLCLHRTASANDEQLQGGQKGVLDSISKLTEPNYLELNLPAEFNEFTA